MPNGGQKPAKIISEEKRALLERKFFAREQMVSVASETPKLSLVFFFGAGQGMGMFNEDKIDGKSTRLGEK